MSWLIEILGPQHSGKTSIADLTALILEENGTKCLRVEEDGLLDTFFPAYFKLRAARQREKVNDLLKARRPLLADVSLSIIRKGLDAGYTVIHDHITTRTFRQDAGKEIAKQANACYLSVFVTAPLDVLQERWKHREIDEQKIKEMEETYPRLQALREKYHFTLIIDTVETSMEEAAKRIISRIYPHMNVNVLESATIKHEQRMTGKPANSEDQRPLARLENVQLLRMKDTLIMIHRHKRFIIEETYFKILQLLDGKNTVEHIAERAGADLTKVQGFVRFLCKEKMIVM
ncbi:MAG TPA: AAA family ATPase [Nitrosopumilaceae archaeon]|nr:AAA family ATPase [Nitrosopumilaceae archaeon]